MSTPNMTLVLPIPTVSVGPAYATTLNTAFTLIDAHNHTPGNGVQVPTSGLNINADLPLNSNNLISVRSSRYQSQSSPLSLASDTNCVYVSGGNLYYNNNTGTQIQLTTASGINISGTTGIGGNYAASGASVYYTNLALGYFFSEPGSLYANMFSGALQLFQSGVAIAGANGVTLQVPNALAASYILTLPPALPSVSSVMVLSSTGAVTAGVTGATQIDVLPGFGLLPTGAILPFAGVSAPLGYLACNGTAVSRTTYATLFSVIGSAHGNGDGVTTFNLPDYRGQFLRGVDAGVGRDPDAGTRTAMNAGGNTGNNVGSIEAHQINSHNHGITDPQHSHLFKFGNPSLPGTGAVVSNSAGVINSFGYTETQLTGITVNYSVGSETRPINAYVNFIVKT